MEAGALSSYGDDETRNYRSMRGMEERKDRPRLHTHTAEHRASAYALSAFRLSTLKYSAVGENDREPRSQYGAIMVL